MRLLALVLLLPGAAWADTVIATSHITAVTIYPQGAQVTRQVAFTAAAGSHEVLITDLPLDTDVSLLRLASADAQLGAFALRTDRLPPRDAVLTPAQEAAKAAVKVAEAGVQKAQGVEDGIGAEVEAQQAQIGFLTGIKLDGAGATAEGLQGVAGMIGAQVLTARRAALAAQGGLPAASAAVTKAGEALTKAQEALAALDTGGAEYAALSVTVTSQGAGGHLVVTSFVEGASWAPVYDMALDRKAGKLAVERGVLVSQASGEDWAAVDLTLSTARPSEQSEPTVLYPELKVVGDPVVAQPMDAVAGERMALMEPAPVVTEARITAVADNQGDTVVYHYPSAVDVASGVENLRLALDHLEFKVAVEARAVPRYDATAFVLAKLVNDGPEILLPGTAYLYRDGALVGSTELAVLSPGGKAELGFGAIDGIHLKRDMPERAQGDRGVFTTATQIEEKAVLQVENLTGEAWPVRLLDMVPYSEQEDLQISFTSDPEPSEQDVDGKRGVLAWDFDLAAGEKKAVTLDSVISWPAGKVLQ